MKATPEWISFFPGWNIDVAAGVHPLQPMAEPSPIDFSRQ
jgi:hypothetical protein